MLIAGRIVRVLVVLGFVFCGVLLILSGSGVNLDEMMQGSIGASAIMAVATFLESLVHAVRLTRYELAVGVLMVALALLVALYRT
jgi:hypothetical protein